MDDAVHDLTIQLRTCEAMVTSHATRLDQLEKAQATMATEQQLPMNDVVRELDIRTSKKTNIVLGGVLLSPPLTDAGIVNLRCLSR